MAQTTFSIGSDYFTVSQTGVVDFLFDESLINAFEQSEEKKEVKANYYSSSNKIIYFDDSKMDIKITYVGKELSKKNLDFCNFYVKFIKALMRGDFEKVSKLLVDNEKNYSYLLINYKIKDCAKAIFAYYLILNCKLRAEKYFECFVKKLQNKEMINDSFLESLYTICKEALGQDFLTTYEDLKKDFVSYAQTHPLVFTAVGTGFYSSSFDKLETITNEIFSYQVKAFLDTGVKANVEECFKKLVSSCIKKEEDNDFDKNAIAVKFKTNFDDEEYHLGYLPAIFAQVFANSELKGEWRILYILNNGVKIKFLPNI